MTNEWLQGYIAGLDNIMAFSNTLIITATDIREKETINKYSQFIYEVKENYKKLVKELNETQSKKTNT